MRTAEAVEMRTRLELSEQAQSTIEEEVRRLREENEQLRAQLRYVDSPQFPKDYSAVNARIISRAPGEFDQQVVISAGSNNGIAINTPVVTQDGLVGRVTNVAGGEAQVTLLLDEDSAVQAIDQDTRAYGLVRHGQGQGQLILDRVTKDQNVRTGDVIVTAGTRSRQYPSLFPRGIPVGQVVSVGQTDTALFKQIEIRPYVDFGSLDSVTALVTRKRVPSTP
jgi:rod shape-determining protein MreC